MVLGPISISIGSGIVVAAPEVLTPWSGLSSMNFRGHDYFLGTNGQAEPSTDGDLLIALWHNTRSVTGRKELVTYHSAGTEGLWLETNGATYRFFVNSVSPAASTSTIVPAVDGAWRFLAVYVSFGVANSVKFYSGTYDSTGGSVLTEETTTHAAMTPVFPASSAWAIGNRTFGSTQWMTNVQTFASSSIADADALATALYNGGKGIEYNATVSGEVPNTWWNLDEASGSTTVIDQAGNANLAFTEVGANNIGFDQAGPAWTPAEVGVADANYGVLDMDVNLTTDTGGVDRWDPQYGNLLACGQTNSAIRPDLQADSLYFGSSASGDRLTLDSSIAWGSGEPLTVIVCGYKDGLGDEGIILGGAGNINMNFSDSGSNLVINDGVGFTSLGDTTTWVTSLTVGAVVFTGTNASRWYTGTLTINNDAQSRFFTITLVGNRGNGLDTDTHISDLAVFEAELSDANVRYMSSWMAQKRSVDWGEAP